MCQYPSRGEAVRDRGHQGVHGGDDGALRAMEPRWSDSCAGVNVEVPGRSSLRGAGPVHPDSRETGRVRRETWLELCTGIRPHQASPDMQVVPGNMDCEHTMIDLKGRWWCGSCGSMVAHGARLPWAAGDGLIRPSGRRRNRGLPLPAMAWMAWACEVGP